MNVDDIAIVLGCGKQVKNGDGWLTFCPCHEDKKPSLSVKAGKNN